MNIVENTPQKHVSVFTPLITLKAFIFQVLSDDSSCKQAVASVLFGRLFNGQPANAIHTGGYCKARIRLPLEHMFNAVKTIGLRLHQGGKECWKWKGFNVVILDGTTVLMADTPKNQKPFPQQSCQKPGLGFPILRIVGLISLGTGSIIDYRLGAYQGKGSGETSLFSKLIPSLSIGDILLADRYYCTFAIIALLMEKRVPVLFPQHAKKKTDFRKGKKLGARDHLVEWTKPPRRPVWMSQKVYDGLPETILVREFSIKGKAYVTTLLDPNKYQGKELEILYKERWKVELDFRSIKTNMGMEMLRCKTPEMVQKEIAVHFLAYNLVRGNIVQAGIMYNKFPRQLSFRTAVQVLTQVTESLVGLKGKRLSTIVRSLLKAIASSLVGQQKRKSQPRVIKRRPKAYPLLTKMRT